jgi:hypothetical protein
MQDDNQESHRPTFLNSKQAADYLGLKPNTLAKMRVYGNGPKYRKHGFRVLYSLDELNAWSDASRRSSTSETPDE